MEAEQQREQQRERLRTVLRAYKVDPTRFEDVHLDGMWDNYYRSTDDLGFASREGLKTAGLPAAFIDHILWRQAAAAGQGTGSTREAGAAAGPGVGGAAGAAAPAGQGAVGAGAAAGLGPGSTSGAGADPVVVFFNDVLDLLVSRCRSWGQAPPQHDKEA